MALPASRNTTYSPSDPVKSNDLNAIQDFIVSLSAASTGAKHGEIWLPIVPAGGTFDNARFQDSTCTVENTGAPWSAAIPIPVLAGTRVKNVRIQRQGSGSSSMSLRLRRAEFANGPSQGTVKTVTVSPVPAAWGTTDLALGQNDWITTTRTLVVWLYVDGAGSSGTQRFAFPEVLIDRV